ncbi:hypothetical protein CCR75_004500 [Bremia lactucae]|uniref:Uncharacterized protein n=1 Tax=Bremia lactucae TaxID=4779 RepID=A0A976FK74_BRELC|nr:hypothetical protein CCR75_004500 [Bremia lactucae]
MQLSFPAGLSLDTNVTITLHSVSVEVIDCPLVYRERVTLDVQDPSKSGVFDCLVLGEEENQFIIGNNVLSSLGINVGAMIAKLAEGPAMKPSIQMVMILPPMLLFELVSMSIRTF